MSTLKKLYRLFLRDKVNEQYELSYIEGAVLGENILNGYYFLVLRKIDWDSGKVYHNLFLFHLFYKNDIYIIPSNPRFLQIFYILYLYFLFFLFYFTPSFQT